MPYVPACLSSETWERQLLQFSAFFIRLTGPAPLPWTGWVQIITHFCLATWMVHSPCQRVFDMLIPSPFWNNLLGFKGTTYCWLTSSLAAPSWSVRWFSLLLPLLSECPWAFLYLDLFFSHSVLSFFGDLIQSASFQIWSLWKWLPNLYSQLRLLSPTAAWHPSDVWHIY